MKTAYCIVKFENLKCNNLKKEGEKILQFQKLIEVTMR